MKPNQKIAIKGITISLKNKEIVLSMDEIKELKQALDSLLGHQMIQYTDRWWYQPHISSTGVAPVSGSTICVNNSALIGAQAAIGAFDIEEAPVCVGDKANIGNFHISQPRGTPSVLAPAPLDCFFDETSELLRINL